MSGAAARECMQHIVALDCEMVQIKGRKQVLAHVCVVDSQETVRLNTHVDPGAPVTDYLTRYSGLRPGDLDGAPSFESVRTRVAALLEGSAVHQQEWASVVRRKPSVSRG